MILHFYKKNKKAIKAGFIWMSVIFTSIVIILLVIGLVNNQVPEGELFALVILFSSLGLPVFCLFIGFLRWWWDSSVTNRNFISFPFNRLEEIGFKKMIMNENSQTSFTSEYYSGKIVDFYVVCDVDTQYYNEILNFKFYIILPFFEKSEYRRINKKFTELGGTIGLHFITKKYNYKKHGLESVVDLKEQLTEFANTIKMENIKPIEFHI